MSMNTEKGKTESVMDDAAITTKIKAKLAADDLLSAFSVKVSTDNCVVTLKGKVKDNRALEQLLDIARKTAGVKDVLCQVEVEDKNVNA